MTPRLWNIVLHLHADATATVHVHVDTRRLLPTCESEPAEEALGYVEAALVDYRPEDQLALRVQSCVGSPHYKRCHDALGARLWLRERVSETLRALASQRTGPHAIEAEPPPESGRSGIRPALGDAPEARHWLPFKAKS